MGEEEFSPKMLKLVDYLTNSLMLDTPMISDDPAYQQLEGTIPSIIEMAMLSLDKDNVDDLSSKEIRFVVLKTMYTLYLRLAVATAPEFDASAEQVTFKKGNRFNHYITLADRVKKELEDELSGNYFNVIEFADVRLASRDGKRRNYNLSETQAVKLQVDNVGTNTVEISWKMFDTFFGSFAKYTLMVGQDLIYDEYAVPKLQVTDKTMVKEFFDIKRTKFRVSQLNEGEHYYIALMMTGTNGAQSIQQVEVTTEVGD